MSSLQKSMGHPLLSKYNVIHLQKTGIILIPEKQTSWRQHTAWNTMDLSACTSAPCIITHAWQKFSVKRSQGANLYLDVHTEHNPGFCISRICFAHTIGHKWHGPHPTEYIDLPPCNYITGCKCPGHQDYKTCHASSSLRHSEYPKGWSFVLFAQT